MLDHAKPYAPFLERFTIEFCRKHQVVVTCDEMGDVPTVLIASSSAISLVDVISRKIGQAIPFQVVDADVIRKLTNQFYEARVSLNQAQHDIPTLDDVLGGDKKSRVDDLLESDTRGPVVQLVNKLLLDAVQLSASDIHLQPFEKHVSVRMRLDGVLTEVQSIPTIIQDEVVSRLKVAGSMDIAEKRLPQDGRATVCVGDRVIDLRLASMPTSYGERVVVRLLDKSASLYQLAEIGMEPAIRKRFQQLIQIEHGLILVTGPTGSGKSTTLYAGLQELDTNTRNAVTLEDPIEYQLDGISQTQINTKKGMTFASGLRSVLRQDPDIIMLGEIRDQETAVMAIQSALTGHMVFSTLHTNDAASAVTRLLDLGIEPYLVSSSLLAVLAQRLVRRICKECSGENPSPLPPLPEDGARGATILSDPYLDSGAIKAARISSCPRCRGTGYRGREGIYELLVVNDSVRELIQSRAAASKIRDAAVAEGMKLLRDDGLRKVEQGITTLEEIERVTMRTGI